MGAVQLLLLCPTDMKLLCIAFLLFFGTGASAAQSSDEVHFVEEGAVVGRRQAKQSVLGCLMGCTRELRSQSLPCSQSGGNKEDRSIYLPTSVTLTLRGA